jgi:hypothetical protein
MNKRNEPYDALKPCQRFISLEEGRVSWGAGRARNHYRCESPGVQISEAFIISSADSPQRKGRFR